MTNHPPNALNEIPPGWTLSKLKWLVLSLESGRREVSDTEDFEGEALSLGGEHIRWNGDLFLDNPRYVSLGFFDSLSSGKVKEDDVLLVKDGATIGKVAHVTKLPASKVAVNEHVFLLRFGEDNHSRFFFYALQSPMAQNQIWLEVRGSAQPGLNSEFQNTIVLLRPPKKHQTRLADYLDRRVSGIDALIAAKGRLVELLGEKRRALITEAVTRGLNPNAPMRDSGLPWVGMIPSHWEVMRAKYLFMQTSLSFAESDDIVTCFRDGQVTLRKNRREEGFTNAVKETSYQGILSGQLVLHSMDAFAGAIGVSDSKGKCSLEYIICDPIRDDVLAPYYGHLLRVMALNGFIQASCPAVRERAPRIRFSDFGPMPLPIPPVPEQREIVRYIMDEARNINALREATSLTIELLQERRAAFIDAAVTGKITPEVPSDC